MFAKPWSSVEHSAAVALNFLPYCRSSEQNRSPDFFFTQGLRSQCSALPSFKKSSAYVSRGVTAYIEVIVLNLFAGKQASNGMDICIASKARKGINDGENKESSGARRFRNFSPEPNDDEFQQSPFRSTGTERSSTENREVGSKCAGYGYADVEDIADKGLCTKTSRKRNSKRSLGLTRQTCTDSIHDNAEHCATASATEESENLFQSIFKKAKRRTPLTAFSEFVGPAKPVLSTYARKETANTPSAYRKPLSTTADMLTTSSKDHSGGGGKNAASSVHSRQ